MSARKRLQENAETFRDRLLRGGLTEEQIQRVMFVYQISKEAHRRQIRDDKITRYFEHPRKGCLVLMDELGVYDYRLLIAFLLHDVGEDTQLLGSIVSNYHTWRKDATFRLELLCHGSAPLVIGLTKPAVDNVHFFGKKEAFDFYIDQLSKSSAEVKILKMVDRLINLRDLSHCPLEKIKKQIEETEQIYLPIFYEVSFDKKWGKVAKILFYKITEALRMIKKQKGLAGPKKRSSVGEDLFL